VLASRAALRGEGENTFVWTVQGEQVKRVSVRAGEDFGDSVQITSGLDGGEALIVSGPDTLREGMRVKQTAATRQ
jgi:multidrug efflux pump subunit AcrA (membrane-fusion protein)